MIRNNLFYIITIEIEGSVKNQESSNLEGSVLYLHEARVLIGREAVDVIFEFLALGQQDAGKALLHVICPWNLLFPVTHVDLHHL